MDRLCHKKMICITVMRLGCMLLVRKGPRTALEYVALCTRVYRLILKISSRRRDADCQLMRRRDSKRNWQPIAMQHWESHIVLQSTQKGTRCSCPCTREALCPRSVNLLRCCTRFRIMCYRWNLTYLCCNKHPCQWRKS